MRLEAAQAYGESLDIRRRLLKDDGETPQAIRDLMLVLERYADVTANDDQQRRALYREALSLARRLQLVFRDDPRGSEAQQQIRRLEQKCST